MTNREMLQRIAVDAVYIGQEILNNLNLISYSKLTLQKWDTYAGYIKELREVLRLLEIISVIDYKQDLEAMPELKNDAITSGQTSGGNRCYFQTNEIKNWLEFDVVEEKENHRFDLDWV